MTALDRARLRETANAGSAVGQLKSSVLIALLDAADERDRLLAGSAARTMDFTYDTLRAAAEQALDILRGAMPGELADVHYQAIAALDAVLGEKP